MGQPADIRQVAIMAPARRYRLRAPHGQPAVRGARPLPTPDASTALGPRCRRTRCFRPAPNVEFAQVEAPDRVRILIWERGVGPTSSSGTGSSAAAVAAAAHGGASRRVDVMAPGRHQRVEWQEDGVYLTGWAELVFDGRWLGAQDGLMRTFHSAIEAVETYSPAEERSTPPPHHRPVARSLVCIALLMAPLPLPRRRIAGRHPGDDGRLLGDRGAAAGGHRLLGPVLAVILGVAPVRAAFAPFADPIIFVFIGGFMLAEAMFVHGVDRRIAYTALSWRFVGSSATPHPARLRRRDHGALDVDEQHRHDRDDVSDRAVDRGAPGAHGRDGGARQFALVMMLITSFGASIGGMGTPVGTPPNLIGIGMLERLAGVDVTFFQWMLLGVPAVVLMFAS